MFRNIETKLFFNKSFENQILTKQTLYPTKTQKNINKVLSGTPTITAGATYTVNVSDLDSSKSILVHFSTNGAVRLDMTQASGSAAIPLKGTEKNPTTAVFTLLPVSALSFVSEESSNDTKVKYAIIELSDINTEGNFE